MEVKEQVRLQMIELKAEMRIEAYTVTIQRLEEENALYGAKNFPDLVRINNEWIEKTEEKIQLLTNILNK